MGRQLFLHHYLPAHLASALVTGALLEFICNIDAVALDDSITTLATTDGKSSKKDGNIKKAVAPGFAKRNLTARERMGWNTLVTLWSAAAAVMAVVIGGWWYFLPLTYGKPGLDPAQVNARKWLGYDLHFAK